MKRYDKYKVANIEWIGEIPEHWEEVKMKYIGDLYGGLSGKSGIDFKQPDNPNNKPYIPFSNILNNEKINPKFLDYVVINEEDTQSIVKKDDLFFLMSSENYDDVGKSSVLESDLGEVYLNSFCKGFRLFNKSIEPIYLNWLLLAYPNRCRLMVEANGFTRINLKQDKIKDYYIYTPPTHEQTQISSYLDDKTSLIDKLINNNKKLIKLLEEKRTALINKVITKGLDPNVKMKDSGIEWIGEIPEHWEVGKLSVFSKRLGVGLATSVTSSYRKDGIPLLRNQNIKVNHFDDRDLKFLDREFAERNISKAVLGNDVIVVHTGSHIGRATVVPMKYHLAHTFTTLIITPKDYLDSRFLMYTINSKLGISQIDNLQVGIGKNNLNVQQFKDFILPMPPKNEQEEITYVLDKSNKRFNQQVVNIKSENSLLKEYRQSLISNVVTGKIKVANL